MRLSGEQLQQQYQMLKTSLSANESIWLIAGDINNFGLYNKIYSRNIVDILYDLIIEQIDESVSQLKNSECQIYYTVYGDDLIILIKSSLHHPDVIEILQKIKNNLWECCYQIICLDDFGEILSQLTATEQKLLLEELDNHLIFVDPYPRKKGHLALIAGQKYSADPPLIPRLQTIISDLLPNIANSLNVSLNWLYNSQTGCYETFNKGIVWPITISFGGVSLNSSDNLNIDDFRGLLDRVHQNLAISKKSPDLIAINQDGKLLTEESTTANKITFVDIKQDKRRIPLCSLRYFKDIIADDITNDPIGILISLEPTYTIEGVTENLSLAQKQQFRGNPYGVGIKGINQICGQNIGDRLITNMVFSVSDAVLSFCQTMNWDSNFVQAAIFVDRFRFYFSNVIPTDDQISCLAKAIIAYFDSRCEGIKISLIAVNYTFNTPSYTGQSLIYQLELIDALPIDYNNIPESVVIRQFLPIIETDAIEIIESQACQAVQLLQSKHTPPKGS